MIFVFPDYGTLQLALTTRAVPPAISRTAAVAGVDAEGRLFVEPSASLPRASIAELRRLGVDCLQTTDVALTERVFCWPQLLPLRRSEQRPARPEQTPVLFDVPAGHFGAVAIEMLRLGNERQSFRVLAGSGESGERVLLRVVGPPYYTLLRALESPDSNGTVSAPTAFVECAPRVWVQFGYRHPLGEHFKPSAGMLLLVQAPRRWTFLDEAPFRDIHEVLDFSLPAPATDWREGEQPNPLRVPMRLSHAGGTEAAEFWVLRDDPIAQLDNLVRSADDQLLARLAFAVGTSGDQDIVVMRMRPSKFPPPVLVLNACGFRPYLKLPNLFLPCGSRLHPPLRRDAVRKRLADDLGVVTWLQPHGDGGFTPESLPDQAFRPLAEWVDYVLEHERRPLEQWVQSTLFDFEPFTCDDEAAPKTKKPPTPERRRPVAGESPAAPQKSSRPRSRPEAPEEEPATDEQTLAFSTPTESIELRRQLDAAEARFLAVTGPLDAPERQALWSELAALNSALGHDDASSCWLHALWSPGAPVHRWADRWLRAEASLANHHADAHAALAREPISLAPSRYGGDLDRLLADADPTTVEVRGLAAYLLWAACRPTPPHPAVQRLNAARHFLEQHDGLLPIRAAWLAWSSVATLAGGDVLALARARDRLLERLYQNGLRPEQELPSFLRFGGQSKANQLGNISHWFLGLHDRVGSWIDRMNEQAKKKQLDRSKTKACVKMVFAYGLARLAESEPAERLAAEAASDFKGERPFFEVISHAYQFRIRQALKGKPARGPLPADLLAYRERLGKEGSYPVDRLREYSRILEPEKSVDPYVQYGVYGGLGSQLAQVAEESDPTRVTTLVKQLLDSHEEPGLARARVLWMALWQAPRVNEDLATFLLDQLYPTFDSLPASQNQEFFQAKAQLLEKGLYVAAHFDQRDHVEHLLTRFRTMIGVDDLPVGATAYEALAGQCIRSLRKLGLRTEIELVLRTMLEVILNSSEASPRILAKVRDEPEKLSALAHVAAGLHYFGKDEEASTILDAVRAELFSGKLNENDGAGSLRRGKLACCYASVLALVRREQAQKRIDELFDRLESVYTSWRTPGFCVVQTRLAEAVVLAVVSDDFIQGAEMRRWLDDDEYLIRRRIHEDLRAMLARES